MRQLRLQFAFVLCWFAFVLLQRFTTAQQSSSGINLSNRRVSPPRISPSSRQPSRPSIPSRRPQPVFNPFAHNPAYVNAAFLAQRVVQLETEMVRVSSALNAMSNSYRAPPSSSVTERLGRIQQDVQGNTVRIEDNQENVDRTSQELEYIKNSNAAMQKRMNNIEAKQSEQQKSMETMQRKIEKLQLKTLESASNGETRLSTTHASFDETEVNSLLIDVSLLKSRMNDTDRIIESYDSYFQAFASNIDTLSQNTEGLLGEAASTSRSFRGIREDIRNIQHNVQALEERDADPPDAVLVPDIVDNVLSTLDMLNNSVQRIHSNQMRQELALRNLSASIESSSSEELTDYSDDINIYGDTSQDESQMVEELASSFAGMEESIKQIQENQRIFSGEVNLRLLELTSATSTNNAASSNLQDRLQSLEEATSRTTEMQRHLESLNNTVIRNELMLLDMDSVRISRSAAQNAVDTPENRKPFFNGNNPNFSDNDYYFNANDEVVNFTFSSAIDDFITAELLEQRLKTLLSNLSSSKLQTEEHIRDKFQQMQKSLQLQTSRLDGLSNVVDILEEQTPADTNQVRPAAVEFPLPESTDQLALNQLRTEVDTLNSSFSVQSSMLNQAINAMGQYDRRLRQSEQQRRVSIAEMREMRVLLANATDSLSQMSLSVAEHELTIPSIFESLKMGDNVLIDLTQQLYEHDVALEKLNRTLLSGIPLSQNDDASSDYFYLNTGRSGDDTALSDSYATKLEFSNLTGSLTGITRRIDSIHELYRSLENRLNLAEGFANGSRVHQSIDALLLQAWREINNTKNTLELQQNVIASVSRQGDNIRRDVDDLNTSLSSLASNGTAGFKKRVWGDEFIQLLDASVRELRVEVNQQEKWIGNQRRRIRNLEDMQLQMSVRQSDIAEINQTLLELRNVHGQMETVVRNSPSNGENLSQGQDAYPDVQPVVVSSVETFQDEIAITTRESNDHGYEKIDSIDTNRIDRQADVLKDLKTVPVALRLLETQAQRFQEALQTLPQLSARVETLNSMRNLVFQNARDITTFHQTVADLEVDINGVNGKLAVIEFRNQRLNSYQDDLRSRVNSTKHLIERTNDKTIALHQEIKTLDRFFYGNTTELKEKLVANRASLDDLSQTDSEIANRLDNIQQDLQQVVSEDIIRRSDINSRLSLDENRISNIEKQSSRNDDAIVTLTRKVAEEVNSRRVTLSDSNNEIQSLQHSVSDLQVKTYSSQQSALETNRRLNELEEMQAHTSDKVTKVQTDLQLTIKDVEDTNIALGAIGNEMNLFSAKANNIEDDLVSLRTSLATQVNSMQSTQQTVLTLNDEVNYLQQNVQNHSAFIRRADHVIDKHRSDLSYIFEYSSNFTVVLERLKQRIGSNSQESYSNFTREILSEMQLLDYSMQEVINDIATIKRQSSIRNNATIRFEERMSGLTISVAEDKKKINVNKELISRLTSDFSRNIDRIRIVENGLQEEQIARSDLQQVVVENRNQIFALENIRSEMNSVSQDVSQYVVNERNSSKYFQRSLDRLNAKVSAVTLQVNERETTVRMLRQDRISFQESIDQIFLSSSILEELLRTTVTSLAQLKRDFDASKNIRSAVPTLEQRTSELASDVQYATQTINTNENKIERMQELIERMSHAMDDITMTLQSHQNEDRTKEYSRTGEMRQLREKSNRNFNALTSIRTELQRHFQRLQLFNTQLVDFDRRISDSISSYNIPSATRKDNSRFQEDDVFIASSGETETQGDILPTSTIPDSHEVTASLKQLQEEFKFLSLRVLDMSDFMSNLREKCERTEMKLTETIKKVAKVGNVSALIIRETMNLTASELLMTSVQERLNNMSRRLDAFTAIDFKHLKSMLANVSMLKNSSSEIFSREVLAEIIDNKYATLHESLSSKTMKNLSEFEESLSKRFLLQSQHIFNLTALIMGIADNVNSLSVNVEEGSRTKEDFKNINDLREAFGNLETNFEPGNLSASLKKLHNQIEIGNFQSASNDHQRIEEFIRLKALALENEMKFDRLSRNMENQSEILQRHATEIQSLSKLLYDLSLKAVANEDENLVKDKFDVVVPLLRSLIQDLTALNQSTWSIIGRTDQLAPAYDDTSIYNDYEEAETDDVEEQAIYTLSNPDDYEQSSEAVGIQEMLQETNSNLAGISSKLASALQRIIETLTSKNYTSSRPDKNINAVGANPHTLSFLVNATFDKVLERLATVKKVGRLANNCSEKLLSNITSLSQSILSLEKRRLKSLENNQNLTIFLEDEIRSVKSEVLTSNVGLNEIRNDIASVNQILESYSASSEIQELAMNNLRLMQDTQSRNIRECRNTSRLLSSELSASNESLKKTLLDTEKRLLMRLSKAQEQLSSNSTTNRDRLNKLTEDVAAQNSSMHTVMSSLASFKEDVRSNMNSQNAEISSLQSGLEEKVNLLQELFESQQAQQKKTKSLQENILFFEDQVEAMRHEMDNFTAELKWLNNRSQSFTNLVLQITPAVQKLIEQKFSEATHLLKATASNTTAFVREIEWNTKRRFNQLETRVNVTLGEKISRFVALERVTESLSDARRNLELSIMRQSAELRNLVTMIQGSESLLNTITESVELNSNQVAFLTGQFLEGRAGRGESFNLAENVSSLSDTIANHSLLFERMENQISFLLTQVSHPSGSVRIVVPPVEVPRKTTTTAATPPPSSVDQPLIPPPTDISVSSVSPNTIVVSWLPPVNFKINEYRIIVRSAVNRYDALQIVAVAPPVTVNGLTPSTQYLITVRSVSFQGHSSPLAATIETSARTSPRPAPITQTSATTLHSTTTLSTNTSDSNDVNLSENVPSGANRAPAAVLHCGFDVEGICGFLNDETADFNWTRHNGSTPSSDTGPQRDHTGENGVGSFVTGFYMFIEASRPRQQGNAARLLSPLLEATDGHCLEFYYHMYGVGTGDLNVFVQRADMASTTRVWSDTGNHGNQWKRAKVTVDSDYPFRLVFEAVRGPDYHADTAIDDITVKREPCPQPLVLCGFEHLDLCGFTQDVDDDFDWERLSGATSSADTGPLADHTLGTVSGFYLYLESSNPRVLGDATRLSSPLLGPSTAQCLQFYYHMHGADIGALNVYIRQLSNPTDLGTPIWTKSGPQGNEWMLGTVSIVSSDSFQIVVEGIRGSDYHGDIAIDDITILEGECDQPVCPVGVRFGDVCYRVEKDGKSYQNAKDFCARNGGLLAPIKNKMQQDFIVDLISEEGNQWTLFWIGLDDLENEGRFIYSDNTPMDASGNPFGAWAQGEPNDALGDEDCVNMEYATKNRLWNDVPCNRELWFICQYPVSL